MSKKSSVDSNNYYLYPEWFEGGNESNQSQPSTSSYSYPTLEYIWSNAVRLTRTTHSNLQDEIEYIEANLGGGGNESCNCSALQFGIDSNTTKIENLSTIKLSRDGSQSMTGLLKCESGLETNTIAPYSGDTIECTSNLKLDGDMVGDSSDGLNLIAEDTNIASRIQLTPGSNSKILLGTFSGQSVIPRVEIPEGSGNVSITIRGAHLTPYTDNDQNLGSSSKRWKEIYAVKGNFSGIVIPDNLINSGSYSAIVYKDDTGVYAKDASGNIIAQGTADVDDATVIQSAIDALDYGETLLLKAATYILDRKLTLKPINFIGEGIGHGHGTILKLADNVNDDVIEMYSGGHAGWKSYYRFGKIANLRIHGNRDAQTAGNGIVLAWVEHHKIENVRVDYVYGYGIKVVRGLWNHIEDCRIYECGSGIKIGEYDSTGKYNNGNPYDLLANMTLLENVHVMNCDDYGIHIESGNSNTFINCDTSQCGTGAYICGVSGVQRIWRVIFISHWFESNSIGVKMRDTGSSEGTRYVIFIGCEFHNTVDRDMGTDGHWMELDKSFFNSGKWDGIGTFYKLYVRNIVGGGIYSTGTYLPLQDPVRLVPDSPATVNFGSGAGYLWCQQNYNILTEWDGSKKRYIQAATPVNISSDYSAKQGDEIIVNATYAPVTVTLPDPSYTRRHITIKKVDKSTNSVTINPYSGEKIDGNTSYGLTSQYQSITLTTDGNKWHVISEANEIGGIGPYSAIIYKDDIGVYARDSNGNIIAQGAAGIDDASVIQSAIDRGGFIFIAGGTYIIKETLSIKNGLSHLKIYGELGRTILRAGMSNNLIELGEVGKYNQFVEIGYMSLSGNDTSPIGIKIFRQLYPKLTRLYVAHFTDAGIKIGGYTSHLEIAGCNIASNTSYGIFARYSYYESGELQPLSIRDSAIQYNPVNMFIHNAMAEISSVKFDGGTYGVSLLNVKGVTLNTCYWVEDTYGIKIKQDGGACRVSVIEPYFGSNVNTKLVREGSPEIEWIGGYNQISKSGTATFSGNNLSTQFTITHDLIATPSNVQVTPRSEDASGDFYVTADSSNIYVNYLSAPPSGTDNIKLNWNAKV